MNIVIRAYEYGRGGKCACMFGYTYAGIRIKVVWIGKGGQTALVFKWLKRTHEVLTSEIPEISEFDLRNLKSR